MHDWGVFPNNKRCSLQKKEIFVTLIYSIKTNMITSFFSKFLVTFLRNGINYVVLRAVSSALSDAIKVGTLRAMTIQSTFSDYYCK